MEEITGKIKEEIIKQTGLPKNIIIMIGEESLSSKNVAIEKLKRFEERLLPRRVHLVEKIFKGLQIKVDTTNQVK